MRCRPDAGGLFRPGEDTSVSGAIDMQPDPARRKYAEDFIDLLKRDKLSPWNGVYHARHNDQLLVLLGDGARARVLLDDQPLEHARYRRGVLRWRATAAQPCHGFLRVDLDRSGQRRLVGSVWPAGDAVPADHRRVFTEVRPGHQHPAIAVGRYRGEGGCLDLEVVDDVEAGRRLRVSLNGRELAGALTLEGRQLRCGSQSFALESSWR